VTLIHSNQVLAASPYAWEMYLTYDIQDNSNVKISCVYVMHPEKATTQARFACWQNRDLRVYDEASGTPLLVEARALPDGLVDYIVTFSKPQGDGYKFQVEYLVTGLVKRQDSVILSFFPIIPVRIPSFYFVSS